MILTIGISVFNTDEKYLRACLDSVTNQTGDDIEILICDDCSDAETVRIYNSYAQMDKRIKIICLESNSGISVVRNTIIENAVGKWITFVDSDDIIADDAARDIIENGGESDIVMYTYERFTDTVKTAPKPSRTSSLLSCSIIEKSSIACLTNSPQPEELKNTASSVWSKAFRTEFLKQNGLRFIPGLKKAEDSLFNAEALYCAHEVKYINKVIYFYRNNPGSATRKFNEDYLSITKDVLRESYTLLNKLYTGREDVFRLYRCYRESGAAADVIRLVFFHKDNPKPFRQIVREFMYFSNCEPFKTIFENLDPKQNQNNDRRLILTLARKNRLRLLSFVCRHELCFKIYGFSYQKIQILKRRLAGLLR